VQCRSTSATSMRRACTSPASSRPSHWSAPSAHRWASCQWLAACASLMSADHVPCRVHVSVPLLDHGHVLLLFVLHCTVARKGGPLCAVQGEGDSAIDLLWQKRRQEVGQ
jgi:hypothetical protein